jgi:hypothetical protein
MDGLKVVIDGSALLYAEEKIKSFFGQDYASKEASSWLTGLQTTALAQTKSVKCLGMHKPVPFEDIYQPTSLVIKGTPLKRQETYVYQDRVSRSILECWRPRYRAINVEIFLKSPDDAIIFAGPGWGKTTFLHHIFRRFVKAQDVFPVLITLRRPTAVADLKRFVDTVEDVVKRRKGQQILLLVDGYDEIKLAQQKLVSEALLRFQGFKVGKFYLTCREYYDVINLAASEVHIGRFSIEEKYQFVRAFLSAYESTLNPKQVVDELEARGFGDFLSHPLLLALACIVKTGPMDVQPRSALRLLDRAIDVLSERWDRGDKGLIRRSTTPLDGLDRIQVLKRLAFIATTSFLPQSRAEALAQELIDLLNCGKVRADKVLLEIARFYGIIVPTEDGWEFVHRTVHDFLAASYWVETGGFASVERYEWSTRTAYAACLIEDATIIFEKALRAKDGLPVVVEMLSNGARMSPKAAASALLSYFSQPDRASIDRDSANHTVNASLSSEFIRAASSRLLERFVEQYSAKRSVVGDALIAYCLAELRERGAVLDYVTYDALKNGFRDEEFAFNVPGSGRFRIADLDPARETSNRLPASCKGESPPQ